MTTPNDNNVNSAYVRKFSFRPFSGLRRGRIYRIWQLLGTGGFPNGDDQEL